MSVLVTSRTFWIVVAIIAMLVATLFLLYGLAISRPKGDKGDTGSTGPAGVQGNKGDTGSPGASGANGAQGSTGQQGDTGAAGSKVIPVALQGLHTDGSTGGVVLGTKDQALALLGYTPGVYGPFNLASPAEFAIASQNAGSFQTQTGAFINYLLNTVVTASAPGATLKVALYRSSGNLASPNPFTLPNAFTLVYFTSFVIHSGATQTLTTLVPLVPPVPVAPGDGFFWVLSNDTLTTPLVFTTIHLTQSLQLA